MSENFGKIVQDKNSLTINSSDTSFSKATQLDYAIPASKIASLSSGEFVGIVADNPEERINLKLFHSEIQNDHEAIAKEEAAYKAIPLIGYVSPEDVEENYKQIKAEIAMLIKSEMEKVDASKVQNKEDTANTGTKQHEKEISELEKIKDESLDISKEETQSGDEQSKIEQQGLDRPDDQDISYYL